MVNDKSRVNVASNRNGLHLLVFIHETVPQLHVGDLNSSVYKRPWNGRAFFPTLSGQSPYFRISFGLVERSTYNDSSWGTC